MSRGGQRWRYFGTAMALAWLSFLGYPLSDAVAGARSGEEVAAAAIGTAAFVAVYAWYWLRVHLVRREVASGVAIAALTAIATVLSLVNASRWLTLFIYIIVIAAYGLRWTTATIVIAVLTVITAAVALAGGVAFISVSQLVLTWLLVALAAIGVSRLVAANAELRRAREQIAGLAVSEERLRFARDLHDLLGHTLSVVVLKSELAGRLLEHDPSRAAAEIRDVERVARQSLREVREAVAGYRQPTLATELDGARSLLESAGIAVRIQDTLPGSLPATTESVLAWALREGATNVVRHSDAHRCTVRLARVEGSVLMEVLDDGRGCEAPQPGNGLTGVRERVSERGGTMLAEGAAGHGFRLRVQIPIKESVPAAAAPAAS
jgi:two-component system sensor histidine kinase DesK